MTYAWAVMDGNESPDQYRYADSCHRTREAAERVAAKLNRGNPNNDYYVAHWDATRWAKERPAPEHARA